MRTALIGLLLLAASAAAIYQDQAGQYEWLRQHVGRVKLAQLATRPRQRLVVASEAGVVAALSTKDGALLWRRVLPEGQTIDSLVLAGGRVVVLAEAGKQALAVDLESGQLLWSTTLYTAEGGEALLAAGQQPDAVVLGGTDASSVVVALGSTVQVVSTESGRQLASHLLVKDVQSRAATRLFAEDQQTWAATLLASGSELVIASLAAADGSPVQQTQLTSPAELTAGSLAVSSEGVAALSADGTQLCSGPVEGGGQLTCQPLSQLVPGGASPAALLQGSAPSHLTLQTGSGAAVLQLAGGAVKLVQYFAGATASPPVAGEAAEGTVVGLATPTAGGLQLSVASAADGEVVQQGTAAQLRPQRVDGSLVGVDRLFLVRFKKTGGDASRLLSVFADDSLALAAPLAAPQAPGAWVRHEELASVADVLFIDLPASTPEIEAQWLASQPSLGQALRAQLLTLKAQLMLASEEEVAEVEAYKAATSDRLRPTRDPDGFRKQVVVLTAGGKVAALHNGDGRLLWAADFGGGAAGAVPLKLALWRVPHRVGEDVEVVALSGAAAHVINAHTGQVVRTLPLLPSAPGTAAVGEVIPLPHPVHVDSADQHVFVVVPAAAGTPAALLPDTTETWAAFQATRPGLAFWRVDKATGTVTGLGFAADGAVEERWSVAAVVPGSGQQILTVASQAAGEAVYSPARVTGTGALKFKYLNPNKLLVVAGLPDGAPPAEVPGGGRPALTVLLLDSVTGRVLASRVHKDARGPVHAVLSENFAAYHYFSLSTHRFQVSSLELFDVSPHDLSLLDLALHVTNTTASSWDPTPLEASSATYFTKLPVSVLGLTRTARAVTAKQVLLGSVAGQIYMLDRRFLDPARPHMAPNQKQPTPEQAAEGLPPYQPELPLVGTMFATLDKRVHRLRGIATEPAVLESTSLMFAYGLDQYYTRLLPSRQFDMVPDDFPYALLVLVVVALSVASLVLRRMSAARVLKWQWQ